jgi:hypothetical protein
MSEQEGQERFTHVDPQLDRALGRYAGEPLAGFERRMVSRLREKQSVAGPVFSNWRGIIRTMVALSAVAATAAALLFLGMYLGERRANAMWQQRVNALSRGTHAKLDSTPNTAIAVATSPRPASRVTPVRAHSAVLRSSRHLAEFPTPVPLTTQERELATLAFRGDPVLLWSLLHSVSTTDMPTANAIRQKPPATSKTDR